MMNRITNSLVLFFERSKFNMLAAGWINFLGSPLYYIICAKILPQPYESLNVRLFSSLISIPLLFTHLYKNQTKIFMAVYWYFWIVLALPATFTYLLLMNDFAGIWLVAETVMLFIVMLFIEDLLGIIVTILVGILIAYFVFYLKQGHTIALDARILGFLVPTPLALLCGIYFSYNSRKGHDEKERVKTLQERADIFKTLAGSIAHELRNPLNAINLIGDQIKDVLAEGLNSSTKEKLSNLTSQISDSISGANSIINIILSDLREKPADLKDFSLLKPSVVIPSILQSYGYKNQKEKSRISFIQNESNDFVFNVVSERFTFIMYNLIKNALYYAEEYPNSTVVIGTEERVIKGVNWNSIYVLDTGPGIPPEALPKLFGDFYTSGKRGGTGLGLSFCKRNMKAFSGDIICESEFGKWTKFSLLFPKVDPDSLNTSGNKTQKNLNDQSSSNSQNKNSSTALNEEQGLVKSEQDQNSRSAEIVGVKVNSKKTKILIVDDEKTNLLITKSMVEKNLEVFCEIAHNGKEAAEIEQHHIVDHALVLTDIQMPENSGVVAAKNIRSFNKQIPIVALTSLEYEEMQEGDHGYFNDHLTKPVSGHILYRTIAKLIPSLEDKIDYLGDPEQYLSDIKSKKILIADDQELNLTILAKKLRNIGLEVTSVQNGKELIDVYQKSLEEVSTSANNYKKSQFDIIVTDVNMPILLGTEAAQEIRKIEAKNNTSYKNRMPIIALSGDGELQDLQNFFNAGMTDYFIKGSNIDKLIKIIAIYLNPNGNYKNLRHKKEEELLKHQFENNVDANKDAEVKIINSDKIANFSESDRAEFFKMFLEGSQHQLEKIEEAVGNSNNQDLSLAIHALKGISGNIGADKMFNLVNKISYSLKNNLPLQDGWFEALKASHVELEKEITRYNSI